VRLGKAAALPMDYPPADVLTTDPRTRPNYQLASTTQYEPGVYGVGFVKDERDLRDTVASALEQLMADGTYRRILDKWNVDAGSIRQIAINGGA
jgi:polar amino acid transport system substrate-binding protein